MTSVAAVPHDERLPSLPRLLDTNFMAELFRDDLRCPEDLRRVSILTVRYRPRRAVVVHYKLELRCAKRVVATAIVAPDDGLEARVAAPFTRLLSRRVAGRTPTDRPLSFARDLGALIQWFPLDVALPVLSTPWGELLAALADVGIEPVGPPQVLAYKPGRRATLRAGGHVLKLHRRDSMCAREASLLRSVSSLRSVCSPSLSAEIRRLRLTVRPFFDGRFLTSGDEDIEAGAVLARLHAAQPSPLSPLSPAQQLAAAAGQARLAATVAPRVSTAVERLLGRLSAATPAAGPLVPSHGDFYRKQLLLLPDGRVAVIDPDRMCAAPPGLDLAAYSAQSLGLDPHGLLPALSTLERMLEGYGERPVDLSWHLSVALLRRTYLPFRKFEADWPLRVEGMVRAAEAALAA
jgi:hypothetical protein